MDDFLRRQNVEDIIAALGHPTQEGRRKAMEEATSRRNAQQKAVRVAENRRQAGWEWEEPVAPRQTPVLRIVK